MEMGRISVYPRISIAGDVEGIPSPKKKNSLSVTVVAMITAAMRQEYGSRNPRLPHSRFCPRPHHAYQLIVQVTQLFHVSSVRPCRITSLMSPCLMYFMSKKIHVYNAYTRNRDQIYISKASPLTRLDRTRIPEPCPIHIDRSDPNA